MTYDGELEQRIDALTAPSWRLMKSRMFGGVGYLRKGNIAFGIWKDGLIVRCGPDRYLSSLRKPHVGEFDITGRSMKGWILVQPEGIKTNRQLMSWMTIGYAFASTLPSRSSKRG